MDCGGEETEPVVPGKDAGRVPGDVTGGQRIRRRPLRDTPSLVRLKPG